MSNQIEFWGTLGTGAAIGLVGMGFSILSKELTGHKLG